MLIVALTLRLPADLHRLARIAAASRGQSLQAWLLAAIRGAILHQSRRQDGKALAAELAVPHRSFARPVTLCRARIGVQVASVHSMEVRSPISPPDSPASLASGRSAADDTPRSGPGLPPSAPSNPHTSPWRDAEPDSAGHSA